MPTPANWAGRLTERQATARRSVRPLSTLRTVMRGSHAVALARATACRLARVAARTAPAPEEDGCTSGSRPGKEETTTRTLVPVRRAATRLPFDPHPRQHARRRGVGDVHQHQDGRRLRLDRGEAGRVGHHHGGPADRTRAGVGDHARTAVADHQQAVAVEQQARGPHVVEADGAKVPGGRAGHVGRLHASGGDAEDGVAVRLHEVRLVHAGLLDVGAREIDAGPRASGRRRRGPAAERLGGGDGAHGQRGAQSIAPHHGDRPAPHVAEESLARREPGQRRLRRPGRRCGRRRRGGVAGGGRAPAAGDADRRERSRGAPHEQSSTHHVPPSAGCHASRGPRGSSAAERPTVTSAPGARA